MYMKMQESCSLKAFFSYTSQLSGAHYPCFSSVFTLGVAAAQWLLDIIVLPGCPGRMKLLMTVTTFFINIAGNTPFLTFMT